MDESRKQFERYIKLRGMSAMKRDGAYVESATRFAFDIWKASRTAIEIEFPESAYGQMDAGDAIDAVEVHGLKVKK